MSQSSTLCSFEDVALELEDKEIVNQYLLWVHSPNTKHVRVCVHVECSCILGVVILVVLYTWFYGCLCIRECKQRKQVT
jgi:hypothetical protein